MDKDKRMGLGSVLGEDLVTIAHYWEDEIQGEICMYFRKSQNKSVLFLTN